MPKKLDNHAAAVELYVAHYNLCTHQICPTEPNTTQIRGRLTPRPVPAEGEKVH
jgi:hypothetical protein